MKTLKNIIFRLVLVLGTALILPSCCEQNNPRVIVLGLDGMMPEGIEYANTPNLHRLIDQGTVTFKGRSVYPTSSGANWSSMILGCGPDQHGIDNNGWTLETRKILPVFEKDNGYSPSIFDVLREKNSELRLSAVLNWTPIANYFDSNVADTVIGTSSTEETINKIIEEFVERDADFVFSQIDHMDYAGHSLVYGSQAYLHEAEVLDKELGRLFNALEEKDLFEDTYFLVIGDHGGKGYGHGNKTMQEYTVPFIISGPGIQQGKLTLESVEPFDIAATAARIFNCEIPAYWIGSPVRTAFGKNPELLGPYLPKPRIIIDSIDSQATYISCEILNNDAEILYRIGDTGGLSKYDHPISIPHGDKLICYSKSAELKSAEVFYHKSFSAHKGIDAMIKLNSPPSQKYSALGAQSLSDGLTGSVSYSDQEWMGFQENNLEVSYAFEQPVDVTSIQLRYLENIKSWIFPPKSISIYISDNGVKYRKLSEKDRFDSFDVSDAAIKKVAMSLERTKVQFVKITIENYGKLPSWHSGAGNNAWLFVDEIIVE